MPVSKKRKTTKRRKRAPARKTTKRKTSTRKTATRKSATPEERQLAMFHNPFSRATKQPKIPDGKMTESLGYQTQSVGELQAVNATSTIVGGGDGTMHILLYAGQNSGMIVWDDLAGCFPDLDVTGTPFTVTSNRYRVVGFEGASDIQFGGTSAALGGLVNFSDDYAYWRVVSTGLRLSLLNSAEEDDGWWEAIRITEPMSTLEHAIFCKDNVQDVTKGTVIPNGVLNTLRLTGSLANQTSYTTGLLRDIKNHTFNLHGIMDHHDFKQQMERIDLAPNDIANETTLVAEGITRSFDQGRPTVERLIDQYIDNSYDMIYLRIHGRAAGTLSRLHYNLVSNQEVNFGSNERESRFHTRAARVANMDEHSAARSSSSSAAHLVPM